MNSKDLLFSIITLCFNSEKTIERTILSVLNQTYTNFEYIIIDGGSTDSTLEIIEKYKDKFGDKLKVISEKDNGIYDAMNKGIRLSTGDLVGIINSDDYYEYDSLENIKNKYNFNKYEIVYGITRMIDSREKEINLIRQGHNFLDRGNICHQACFISLSIHKDFYEYDLQYKYAADYDFMLKSIKNESIIFTPVDNIVANFTIGGASSSIDCLIEINNIFKKYNIISNIRYAYIKINYSIKKYILGRK